MKGALQNLKATNKVLLSDRIQEQLKKLLTITEGFVAFNAILNSSFRFSKAQNSMLTRAALWYAKQKKWEQIWYGFAACAFAILVGVITNILALPFILVSIYSGCVYFLSDHFQSLQRQNDLFTDKSKRLKKQISQLQKTTQLINILLAELVQAYQDNNSYTEEVSEKLSAILVTLRALEQDYNILYETKSKAYNKLKSSETPFPKTTEFLTNMSKTLNDLKQKIDRARELLGQGIDSSAGRLKTLKAENDQLRRYAAELEARRVAGVHDSLQSADELGNQADIQLADSAEAYAFYEELRLQREKFDPLIVK